METTIKWTLPLLSAATLMLNVSTSSAQVFSSIEVLRNRAVAASPRAREEHPSLTRGKRDSARDIDSHKVGARTPAAPPRVLEQFPELARPIPVPQRHGADQFASVVMRPVAGPPRPRDKEDYPWLTREDLRFYQENLKIAP